MLKLNKIAYFLIVCLPPPPPVSFRLVLGLKPRALCMLWRRWATKSLPSPLSAGVKCPSVAVASGGYQRAKRRRVS